MSEEHEQFHQLDLTPALRLRGFLSLSQWTIAFGLLVVSVSFLFSMFEKVDSNNRIDFGSVLLSVASVLFLAGFLWGVNKCNRLMVTVWAFCCTLAVLVAAGVGIFGFARGFSAPLIIPCIPILMLAWLTWWAFARETNQLVVPSQSPVIQSLFTAPVRPQSWPEQWLGGGWRTTIVVGLPSLIGVVSLIWLTFRGSQREFSSLGYFLQLVLCALALTLVLIPVLRVLRGQTGLEILAAIARNKVNRRNGSFLTFVLRHGRFNRYVAIYCLLMLCSVVGFAVLLKWSQTGLALVAVLVGIYGYRQALKYRMVRLNELEAKVWSRFTLYLRSFSDDTKEVQRNTWMALLARGNKTLSDFVRLVRFEEVVVRTIWPYNPVLAIGVPREVEPEVGAIRTYSNVGEWQRDFERLASGAASIMIAIGATNGIKWEYEQMSNPQLRGRLTLLMVPGSPEEMLARWHGFFSAAGAVLQCPESLVQKTLSVRFDSIGLPCLLCADRRSINAYRLALHICRIPQTEFECLLPRSYCTTLRKTIMKQAI